jgi:hypothetical protein
MTWNTKKGYGALAVALLIFTTSVALSSYKIQREYHRLNQRFIPKLWVAAQTELEFYRFRDALHLYIREDSPAQIDEVAKRLYILMSRLPLMLQGSESAHVRAVSTASTGAGTRRRRARMASRTLSTVRCSRPASWCRSSRRICANRNTACAPG